MTTLQVQKDRLATMTENPILFLLVTNGCLFNAYYLKLTQVTKFQSHPTSVLLKYTFCHIKFLSTGKDFLMSYFISACIKRIPQVFSPLPQVATT